MPDKFVDKVYDYDVGQIRILFSSCCDVLVSLITIFCNSFLSSEEEEALGRELPN